MKTLLVLPLLFLCFATRAQVPEPSILVGEWQVDLRPTPDAEPYFQKLIIAEVSDDSFSGTFYYDSEIQEARINTDWDELTIAFFTEDNSGPYNTSARLVDGMLKGTTHSIGRDFVSVWTATKVE